MKLLSCTAISIVIVFICLGQGSELRGQSVQADKVDSSLMKVESPTIVLTLGTFGTTWSFFNLGAELTVLRFAKDNDLYLHSLRVSVGFGEKGFSHGFVPILLRSVFLDYDKHVEVGIGCNVIWNELVIDSGFSPPYVFSYMGNSPVNPLAVLCYRSEPQDWGFVFRFTAASVMYNIADKKIYFSFGFDVGVAF